MTIASRALSITDAKGRQGARVLPCRLRSARCDRCALLARHLGDRTADARPIPAQDGHRPSADEPDPDALKRTEAALAIWQASQPVVGTPVETYLCSRGLHVSPPPAIRFHAGLKHPSGGVWPAMVALVTLGVDGAPIAIHRTFLARDGVGKAPVDPAKMMLGPCRGGVVRLA